MHPEIENKKQFTYKEVKDFIRNVFEAYNLYQSNTYKERFEEWLNWQGLNWNNGANEDKEEYFFQDELESFIY